MKQTTPTPRTDSQSGCADRFGDSDVVRVSFARELETELSEAVDANARLLIKLENLQIQLTEARTHRGDWIPASEQLPYISGWRWIQVWDSKEMLAYCYRHRVFQSLPDGATHWRFIEPPKTDAKATQC